MPANRLNNIIIIRVIATLMVVAYHSLCIYTNRWDYTDVPRIIIYEHIAEILNRVDMPAFVFISGYLFSRQITKSKFKNSSEIIWYKANRLLIPYLFWMIINLMLVPQSLTFTQIYYGFNHLWFLPMLFQQFIVAVIMLPLWKKFSGKANLLCLASMLLFFFVAYYKGWNIPANYIKTYFPVFYFGMITEKFQLIHTLRNWHKYILPITFCCYILSCIFLFPNNPAIRDIVIKLTVYVIIFSSMSLLASAKDITHPTFTYIDKYSMGIYLIHHILIQYTLSFHPVFLFFTSHYIIGPILIFTASIICSISMASILQKTPYLQKVI